MECGETDLKTYLANVKKANQPLDTNMIRLTWQQMLTAVNVIHQHNIIHSDLKPANFLFVKGSLKLIDFGIARTIASEATSVIRETQVGTINYISPEALLDVSDTNGRKSIRVRSDGHLDRRFAAPAMCGLSAAFSTRWSTSNLPGGRFPSLRS